MSVVLALLPRSPISQRTRLLTSFQSLGPMLDSEQGKKLGNEVWRETIEVLKKEAPDIKDIIEAR